MTPEGKKHSYWGVYRPNLGPSRKGGGTKILVILKGGGWHLGGGSLRKGGVLPPLETMHFLAMLIYHSIHCSQFVYFYRTLSRHVTDLPEITNIDLKIILELKLKIYPQRDHSIIT